VYLALQIVKHAKGSPIDVQVAIVDILLKTSNASSALVIA